MTDSIKWRREQVWSLVWLGLSCPYLCSLPSEAGLPPLPQACFLWKATSVWARESQSYMASTLLSPPYNSNLSNKGKCSAHRVIIYRDGSMAFLLRPNNAAKRKVIQGLESRKKSSLWLTFGGIWKYKKNATSWQQDLPRRSRNLQVFLELPFSWPHH